MDRIRVGIIGCGGIFRNLHSPYYQEPTRRADIVAIADINETSANEQADRFGADAYTDYRALLDRQDIDAVDVCVHPRPHLEITRAAADAGKHILMEKPMCCNVAEGDEMVTAAENAGVLLMVAYMMRFDPGYMKLKSLLEDGTLGTLQMAYNNQIGYFSPERHPWLFVKAESGGMLVEQAIHNLDLWLWLYGPATSVYGYTSHVPLGGTYPAPEQAVENNAVLTVHFKNGGIGMMIKSWAAQIGHSGSGLVTSNGSATLGRNGLRWKTHDMASAEEFTAPLMMTHTVTCLRDSVNRDIGVWQPKVQALIIGFSASQVKQNRQPTDRSGETALNWQKQHTAPHRPVRQLLYLYKRQVRF